MEKWEYMTHKTEMQSGWVDHVETYNDELNSFGEQNWELVSSYTIDSRGTTLAIISVFKRRKA
ncbi:DUF4177 domain-containing protein [Cohnella herbarum]|uniref:DUF4177 domain-containing protein n=1 Tax=Cohnella herbarum TaxID=2728023 RepID=A0A7Z2ZKU2_9BACL|nr:DUF4177 domain-containing protein [Cohnella herbarum]QJD83541.1 DUF4177 domain-containing protein [Cohnella herbarum]